MQEIQNSGETDPEIWKDCQVRSTENESVTMENSSRRAIRRDVVGGEAEVSRCDGWPSCVLCWAAGVLGFELSLFDRCLPTVTCGERHFNHTHTHSATDTELKQRE